MSVKLTTVTEVRFLLEHTDVSRVRLYVDADGYVYASGVVIEHTNKLPKVYPLYSEGKYFHGYIIYDLDDVITTVEERNRLKRDAALYRAFADHALTAHEGILLVSGTFADAKVTIYGMSAFQSIDEFNKAKSALIVCGFDIVTSRVISGVRPVDRLKRAACEIEHFRGYDTNALDMFVMTKTNPESVLM